jgi:Tfp pilus assembly protein PilF
MYAKRPREGIRRWTTAGLVLSAGIFVAACSSPAATPESSAPSGTPAQLVNAGLAALHAGNDQTARQDFNQVLAEDPSNKTGVNQIAYFDLGVLDAAQGQRAASEAEYNLALNVDPNYYLAQYNLAVEEAVANPQGAIALYRKVVASQPKDVAAIYNLGLLLYQQRQVSEGQVYLAKALALDPSYQKYLPAGVTP